jgi:hypothetical protein
MRRTESVRVGLIIAVCCAILFAGFGGLELLVRSQEGSDQGKFVASFACFGFLFGAILAFDPLPGEKGTDRPLLRVFLGALAGLCLGLLWHWPFEGVALSALVSAGLGYAGTTWAKHI